MTGLDGWLVGLSDGTTVALVVVAAVLLGLRHASDPDHLAAVTTLVADGRGGATRLGLLWGAGHAASLGLLGVPIVLWRAYLPDRAAQLTEAAIGVVIVALAVTLLRRSHGHLRVPPRRTPRQAFGIGVLHGIGGSGGIGVLLLASIANHVLALAALALFAACTAVSMALLSTAAGRVLGAASTRFAHFVPVFGAAAIAFGAWYAVGAFVPAP